MEEGVQNIGMGVELPRTVMHFIVNEAALCKFLKSLSWRRTHVGVCRVGVPSWEKNFPNNGKKTRMMQKMEALCGRYSIILEKLYTIEVLTNQRTFNITSRFSNIRKVANLEKGVRSQAKTEAGMINKSLLQP